MSKYLIVVESGADIPVDLVKHYDISVVPMHFVLGDKFIDDGEISVPEVFAYFDTTHKLPQTSGCSPQDFEKTFRSLHTQYPEATILHLAYSAVTTNSYESAVEAAKDYDFVRHYDTKAVSVGQAAVVLSIAEYLKEHPDADIDTVEAVIWDRIERIQMGFVPDTLIYLHAGGRLSNLAFMGAQILKIKPLIEVLGGKLIATKKYRGSMIRIIPKMLQDRFDKIAYDKEQIFLAYAPGLTREIREFAEKHIKGFGFKRISWMQTGCVVSCHGGPGVFGVIGFAAS